MKRTSTAKHSLWIAVRVERGYITEAKAFESQSRARRIEAKWRAVANPDYDESAVLKTRLPTESRGRSNRSMNQRCRAGSD